MSRIVNLCENIRGNVIFDVLSNYFDIYEGEYDERDLETEEKEAYEIKCNCTRFFSDEPGRIFCKNCWEFMKVEKKKIPMIYVNGLNENEVYPIYIREFLRGYFPYFGIRRKFKNCIIFLDDFYKLGEIIKRSKNCKIYLIGKCLNCKKLDDRIKLILIFFTSPFVDIEIDGRLVKWAEKIMRRIKILENKEKDGEKCKILESFVKTKVDEVESLIEDFRFFEAGKILFLELLPLLEDFRTIHYSIEEYYNSLMYYINILSKIFGWDVKKRVELHVDKIALKAHELIDKTIKDINILLKKFKNKEKAYIKPPSEFFNYFNYLREYISGKTGLEVEIVKELPKKKKVKDVGIYLE